MDEIKCPKCGSLLSKDMVEVNMCFSCAEALDMELSGEDIMHKLEEQTIKHEQIQAEMERKLKDFLAREIIVTTGDLKQEYEVIGPVYVQLSNKGLFSSEFNRLEKYYAVQLQQMKSKKMISQDKIDWGFLYGEYSAGQNDFEKAFFIATEELKKRAKILGADAIICMRQNMNLDTNMFQFFYLQMYGTAVRFIECKND